MTSIRITKIQPILDPHKPGKILEIDSATMDYYFYNGLRVYRIPYSYDTLTENGLKHGGHRDKIFIQEIESSYGLMFDSAMGIMGKKVHIDSATYIHEFSNLHIQELFEGAKTKLIYKKNNPDSGVVHEGYYYESLADPNDKGLLFLSFSSRLNDLPFHFSPYIDSIKDLKLFNYYRIGYGGPVKGYNFIVDTLTATVRMELVSPKQPSEILRYIDKFKSLQ